MAAVRSFTLGSCVVLGLLLAALLVLPVQAEEEAAAGDAVVVLCEAWRVTSLTVIGPIEAITEQDPAAAAAVRAVLQEHGGRRIARLLTPASHGEVVQFSDMRQIPLTASYTTNQGTVATRQAGFQEVGTRLQLTPWRVDDRVRLDLDLRVMGPGGKTSEDPPGRTTTQIQTTLDAPLGAWRMFLSHAATDDVIVVFVRSTGVGAEQPLLETGGDGASFSEAQLERFAAMRRVVDERERKARARQMMERQLARLDVELTGKQREAVVEMTIAYRDEVRETMRTMPRDDREAMSATMAKLWQDYADALATVLDEETAQKVAEGMGRVRGGGGFGRAR